MASASADQREYLVGVYYFSGWWREQPNKWFTGSRDWRNDYPERIPLLGEYNEQATMDQEIAAAARGVDFFQILWYPQESQCCPHQEKLNEGLRMFMASPYSSRMKFTIEFVNHPPFEIASDTGWESACRQWCAAMKHPSYLRVGGRPVFKIHHPLLFLQQNGNNPEKVNERLETFRRIARDDGLPNPLIGAGAAAGGVSSGPIVEPFDYLTTYMEMPDLPRRDEPYPYEKLIGYARRGWAGYGERSKKLYMPYVPAGWDPRPWKDPRPPYTAPTREEWLFALKRAKAALDKYPMLGIPTSGGGRQKAILIYAWNEFGEGGIVAPTRGEGAMKLDAICEVFGRREAQSDH